MTDTNRLYPRFLFCSPQKVKSKGPFIVHTQEPRIIFRIAKVPNYEPGTSVHNGKYILFFLDEINLGTKKIQNITDALFEWVESQVNNGYITIPFSPNQ